MKRTLISATLPMLALLALLAVSAAPAGVPPERLRLRPVSDEEAERLSRQYLKVLVFVKGAEPVRGVLRGYNAERGVFTVSVDPDDPFDMQEVPQDKVTRVQFQGPEKGPSDDPRMKILAEVEETQREGRLGAQIREHEKRLTGFKFDESRRFAEHLRTSRVAREEVAWLVIAYCESAGGRGEAAVKRAIRRIRELDVKSFQMKRTLHRRLDWMEGLTGRGRGGKPPRGGGRPR